MMTTTIRHRAHRGVAFAAMLPMTIDLHDLLGREKLGRLPRQLSIDRARPGVRLPVGELAYWPPGNDIAMTIEPLD